MIYKRKQANTVFLKIQLFLWYFLPWKSQNTVLKTVVLKKHWGGGGKEGEKDKKHHSFLFIREIRKNKQSSWQQIMKIPKSEKLYTYAK